jgi:hypothetical protein
MHNALQVAIKWKHVILNAVKNLPSLRDDSLYRNPKSFLYKKLFSHYHHAYWNRH